MSAAREAYAAALRGEHGAARELLRGALEPGWALALRSTLPGGAEWPAPDVQEARDAEGPDDAVALACAQGCRRAFARGVPGDLRAWRDELDRRVGEACPERRLADAQLALLDAEGVDAGALEAVESAALRVGDAPGVVDAAATRALAELERGDLEAARGHARRAVRMSRTEELVHQQYLAGVVLARVRRHEERPHMALRILGAVERVAPPEWAGWLRHERTLAGDRGWHATGSTQDALRALADQAPNRWMRAEVALADALFDPRASTPAAARWRDGSVHEVPRGLIALEPGTSEHQALVLVDPARSGARVLASSAARGDVPILTTSRPGRIETALAVLALAGGPLGTEDLFARVYGFEFEPRIHRGSLEVLVHRMRDLLGDRAAIEREMGDVELVALEPFAVPDPRVRRTLDDAVLRAIAERPGATAKESAERAGAPLRSVQHALKRLVEGGACEAVKRGRVVCYRVEDTTFTEPTRVLEWREDRS